MTGLTETEHLVAAFEAGGVDYVTKPIKPKEVLARMRARTCTGARQARQARNALDAFGYASITVRARRRQADVADAAGARAAAWRYYGSQRAEAPPAVLEWLRAHLPTRERRSSRRR